MCICWRLALLVTDVILFLLINTPLLSNSVNIGIRVTAAILIRLLLCPSLLIVPFLLILLLYLISLLVSLLITFLIPLLLIPTLPLISNVIITTTSLSSGTSGAEPLLLWHCLQRRVQAVDVAPNSCRGQEQEQRHIPQL
jgi:hypothetical protein